MVALLTSVQSHLGNVEQKTNLGTRRRGVSIGSNNCEGNVGDEYVHFVDGFDSQFFLVIYKEIRRHSSVGATQHSVELVRLLVHIKRDAVAPFANGRSSTKLVDQRLEENFESAGIGDLGLKDVLEPLYALGVFLANSRLDSPELGG